MEAVVTSGNVMDVNSYVNTNKLDLFILLAISTIYPHTNNPGMNLTSYDV
jgi:hypothetical protein